MSKYRNCGFGDRRMDLNIKQIFFGQIGWLNKISQIQRLLDLAFMWCFFDNVLFLYVRARRAEKTMMQLSGGLQSRSGRFRSFQHNQSSECTKKDSKIRVRFFIYSNSSAKRKDQHTCYKISERVVAAERKVGLQWTGFVVQSPECAEKRKSIWLEKRWKTRDEAGN